MECPDCGGEAEVFDATRLTDFTACKRCNGTGQLCDYCKQPVDECDGLCDDSYEEQERHYADE